jgi:hypothetical protein
LSPSTAQPVRGFTYELPFAQFNIQTTRVLSACPGVDSDTGLDRADIAEMARLHRIHRGPAPPAFHPAANIEFSLTATSTRSFAPGAEVTLDYRALAAPMKTTDFAVTLHDNGMLHTINASADDRTGQVVQNVVSGFARLALARAGVGAGPAPASIPPACLAPYYERFKALKRLEVRIRTETDALKHSRITLEALEATATLQGNLSHREAAALVAARRTLASATEGLQDLADQHARLLAQVSSVTTYIWPQTPADSEALLDIPAPEAAFLKGVIGDSFYRSWENRFKITAALSLDRGNNGLAAQALPSAARGPIYITPAPGRLRLCAADIDHASDPVHERAEICRRIAPGAALAEQTSNLPQFAHFSQLPLRNGPFENNSLTATFREDGTLGDAHFQSSRAAAEAASAAFADAAQTVQNTRAQLRADATARATAAATQAQAAAQAQLSDLQRQRDMLQTQAQIAQLQQGAETSSTLAQVQAQQQLVEAQLALERSQRELDALRQAHE